MVPNPFFEIELFPYSLYLFSKILCMVILHLKAYDILYITLSQYFVKGNCLQEVLSN